MITPAAPATPALQPTWQSELGDGRREPQPPTWSMNDRLGDYHASGMDTFARGLLAAHGFAPIAFAPEDPDCRGHSIWLAWKTPLLVSLAAVS